MGKDYITVRALLFAGCREAVGEGQIEMDLPAGATIRDARVRLVEQYPQLAGIGNSLSVARNAEYANDDTAVTQGDELAFIPPVSGGC